MKLGHHIGALFSKEYPKFRIALLEHDKTYNHNLDLQKISNDCEIVQLCPPKKLKSKRDSKILRF